MATCIGLQQIRKRYKAPTTKLAECRKRQSGLPMGRLTVATFICGLPRIWKRQRGPMTMLPHHRGVSLDPLSVGRFMLWLPLLSDSPNPDSDRKSQVLVSLIVGGVSWDSRWVDLTGSEQPSQGSPSSLRDMPNLPLQTTAQPTLNKLNYAVYV